MNSSNIGDRASVATHCIEQAWKKLRHLIPGLPPAVIILLCAGARNRKRGHFAASTWKYRKQTNAHEIGINPSLFADREQLLATLVHEAAHALLFASDGIGGCSDRYYHKKEFRDVCHNLGLDCAWLNTRYGWCVTGWPDPGKPPEKYRDVLGNLRSLPVGTEAGGFQKSHRRKMPVSGHVRLTCLCQRFIYASKSVVEEGTIICSLCKAEFAVQSKKSDDARKSRTIGFRRTNV